MAEIRRKVEEWWFKRQGPSLCQKTGHEPKAPSTRGRQQARLFLRPDVWHEEKTDQRQDSKRSKQPHQQKPEGVELLTWT
jgi:hypothetical protein